MRSMYGTFPEYHNSGDSLRFVRGKYIAETLDMYRKIISALENETLNRHSLTSHKRKTTRGAVYRSKNLYCEPQLGKRGLYGGGGVDDPDAEERERALLWLMAYADGAHSIADIVMQSGIRPRIVREAFASLKRHQLLE